MPRVNPRTPKPTVKPTVKHTTPTPAKTHTPTPTVKHTTPKVKHTRQHITHNKPSPSTPPMQQFIPQAQAQPDLSTNYQPPNGFWAGAGG